LDLEEENCIRVRERDIEGLLKKVDEVVGASDEKISRSGSFCCCS
jgi:hypothetical protein